MLNLNMNRMMKPYRASWRRVRREWMGTSRSAMAAKKMQVHDQPSDFERRAMNAGVAATAAAVAMTTAVQAHIK